MKFINMELENKCLNTQKKLYHPFPFLLLIFQQSTIGKKYEVCLQ